MNAAATTLPDGSLVLAQPSALPTVLDVLVVGGGPAGTAAAFRAKELGLAVLVIEHDDILKRIRDYDKNKPIKPDFGAGKQMGFPSGGSLIEQLQFGDIDKDEMHLTWRDLYVRNSVPARVGVEFLGLEQRDGVWGVKVKRGDQDEVLQARHVVLALGGGMPRTLDIPGHIDAVSTRLGSTERFVGRPTCVIGGGTSAAEAVIAISNTKTAANDKSAVYWAHRSSKMPTVSEALASELFKALNVNGNVRYLPNSDPVAVTKGREGQPFLRIEVDRKVLPDRPAEALQLEFEAVCCVACIGQELPTRLLNAIGIFAVTGGSANRRAFPLTPILETRLPNVYMVGDVLNTAFLECQSFDADTASYEERPHRGNIKRALTDGVIVAEAIAQKLSGRDDIRVNIETQRPAPSAPAPEAPVAASPRAALVRLLQDNVEADQFPLATDIVTIGREECDVCFADDSAMSARHAAIVRRDQKYYVRDQSPMGVFLRLSEERPREVWPGAILKVGSQWLVFGEGDRWPSFTHYDAQGAGGRNFQLKEGTVLVGRHSPDITLAATDGSLSRRHASIALKDGKVLVRDLKSANGTYLKVPETMALEDGDTLQIGHQTLRFAIVKDAPPTTMIAFNLAGAHAAPVAAPTVARAPAVPATVPQPAAGEAPAAVPVAVRTVASAGVVTLPDGLAVTFQRAGRTCALRAGQSICDAAESNKVPLSAECHKGICGSDPIRVLAGGEHLNSMSDDERSTLQDICGLDPGTHRLACLTRPTGPVVVEVVQQ